LKKGQKSWLVDEACKENSLRHIQLDRQLLKAIAQRTVACDCESGVRMLGGKCGKSVQCGMKPFFLYQSASL
jgi:hypothetical protein